MIYLLRLRREAPAGVVHQLLVHDLGQPDLRGQEEVAVTGLARQPLAAQPEGAAGIGQGRDLHLDRTGQGWHADGPAKDGLLDLDRQPQPQVGALGGEALMRRERDGQQRIARIDAGGALPEAAQADHLTVGPSCHKPAMAPPMDGARSSLRALLLSVTIRMTSSKLNK